MHSPPFHPESNEQAEVGVKVVKNAFFKLEMSHPKHMPLETLLKLFLSDYRRTPRTTGSHTSLEALLSYKPKQILDLRIDKCAAVKGYETFEIGDLIYYRSHFKVDLNWIPGTGLNENIEGKVEYMYE